MPEQSTSEQDLIKLFKIENLFSTEINNLINIVSVANKNMYSMIGQRIIADDTQFRDLSVTFIDFEEEMGKRLMEKMKDVFQFAGSKIGHDLQCQLFSKIEIEGKKINEINVTELIENVYELRKQEFINLWQPFFELKNECKDGLREKFTKIYQATYTTDLGLRNKFRGIKTWTKKVNEINVTELIEKVDEFRKQAFIDLWQSFLELKKQSKEELSRKKLEEALEEVLKSAEDMMGQDFQRNLSFKIQENPEKVDEIDVTKLIEDQDKQNKNEDELKKNEFIGLWQSFLELKKQSKDELSKQKLEEALEEVLKSAEDMMGQDFQRNLSFKIQENPEKIDEINVTELIKKVDEFRKQAFIDSWQSFLELNKQSEEELSRKKLEEALEEVLKSAEDMIGQDFQRNLSFKIQENPEKVDEINVIGLIEDQDEQNKNKDKFGEMNDELNKCEFIASWKYLLKLKKEYENVLRKRFTEIYLAAYTVDRDSWNEFQGIKNYLEKLKEADKTSIFEYLTIKYKYSSIRDSMISRRNRQKALERSSKWNEMKKDFIDKHGVAKNENMLLVSQDTIRDYDNYISNMCLAIARVLPKQELAKSDNMLQTILNSNNNMNIFLQRLNAIDFTINSFEKTEHFFEYHINHNKQTHEIDYTLYFDVCKVKYCLNETYNDEQYPFKIDTIRTDDYNFSDDYNVSDLTRYKIGQYTLKEEQYKDIFLPKNMNTFLNIADYKCYSDHLFLKKEQIKRLLQSMYQINGGTDKIFIQFHNDTQDNQEQGFDKGFAFANQKVIYFEEFIDSENQRYLKTIECNLVSEINNEEQFNEIFYHFRGCTIYDIKGKWLTCWDQIKQGKLPNAEILKKRSDIFRDMENIDFTKNENFRIAKITYPKIADSITSDIEMEGTILEKLKEIGSIKYNTGMDDIMITGKGVISTEMLKSLERAEKECSAITSRIEDGAISDEYF